MLCLLLLISQMIPPVEVAKEGWWMVDQGSLSRRAVQTQTGEDLAEMVLFWRDTVGGPAGGQPVIGDVDGDGINEVVVQKPFELQVLDVPHRRVEWRFPLPDSARFCRNTPALGDVDGDGVVEIVAMEDSHRIWILDAARKAVDGMIRLPVFFRRSGLTCPKTHMYVVDLEGDGTPGIVVGGQGPTSDTRTYLYYLLPCPTRSGGQCQDSLVWRKEISVWEPPPMPIEDYDGDGQLEMSFWDFVPNPNLLTVLNTDGTVLWSRTPPNGDSLAVPFAVVDLDSDGSKELLVAGTGGMLISYTYVLNGATGELKWQYFRCAGGLQAFADINNDGNLEIVCGVGGRTARALTSQGYPIWETVLPTPGGAGFVSQGPIVGDFSPSPGLESVFCTEAHGLFLVSSTGKVIWADTSLETSYCRLAAGDVDGDGFSEIAVNTGFYGTYLFDRPTDVKEARPAPGNDHGFHLIPGGFALRRSSPVTVYDLAGRKVFSGKTRTLRLLPGGYVVSLPETTIKMVVGK